MYRSIVGVFVHSEHQRRDVVTCCRCRNDDLLGPSSNVLRGIRRLGEVTSGLNNDVNTQFAPRQVGRIALSEDLDGLAVNDNLVVIKRNVGVETTGDGVVLEQMSERLVVC